MNKAYEDKFKRKIVQLHLEAGRSIIASLAREYNVCNSTISVWCKQFREECKLNAGNKNEYEQMKMIQALNNRILELEKENVILKNSENICDEQRHMVYNFIKDNKEKYGPSYLLKVFNVNKDVYYNFIKHRKTGYMVECITIVL